MSGRASWRDRRPEDRLIGLGGPELQEVGVVEEARVRRLGHPTQPSVRSVVSAHAGRHRAADAGRVSDRPACWSSASPTSPRAAGSTSSTAWPRRSSPVPGVYLLDRTCDASHNRSVFTLAGEHEPVVGGARASWSARRSTRSTWTTHIGRAPADRRGRRHPVRPARRHDDGRLRRAGPGVRRADRRALRPARLPVRRRRRPAPTGCKLADVRRGQYEGLKVEIDPQRPRARLRARADAPAGRRGGRRRAAVPHRLEHQPRLGRRRARQADRPPGPRVRRRPAQGPGERLPRRGARTRPSGPRPGLDEPARLPDDADVAGLGGRRASWPPRTASSSPSRELIGLAPLAAFARRRRPRRRPGRRRRSRRASRRPRRPSGCATSPR